MRILVVGATGMLGRPVAHRLRADGYRVRVLARDPNRARREFAAGFEIVAGDVTLRDTLPAALAGCDAVHVSLRGGNTLESYERIERQGVMNLIAAARAGGVAWLGLVSGAGIGEAAPVSPLMAIKSATAAAVAASGLAYTVFKPTHFMESLPMFIQRGRATVIGHQPHRYHYLAAADFARFVSAAYRRPEAAGQSLTLFGPEAFTMAEALKTYCAIVHPGIPVGSMSIMTARLLGFVTRNRDLAFAATLFQSFARMGESGNPSRAQQLLGTAGTTLLQWCREQAGAATARFDPPTGETR